MHTVAHTICQLAPRLPLALVGAPARTRLLAVAAALPAALTNWIYLECRLRGDAPRVDLTVRVDQRGRDILAGSNPRIALDYPRHTHPVWSGIRALAREWADPSSVLYRGIERVWLEFDIDERDDPHAAQEMPAPGVFVELAREAYAQHSREERLRVAISSLDPLLLDGITSGAARNLRRCWELLPAGVSIPYLGLFPARGSSAVRVCVAGLGDADLPSYLRAVRWPGSYRQLAGAMEALLPPPRVPRPRTAIVNLDVASEMSASVGVEYLLSHAPQRHGEILETAFLQRLVERGFASSAKRDALLSWPATSLQTMQHELWRSRLSRRVNHVKLAYSDHAAPEVKGYLAASYDFHPARTPGEHAPIRMHRSTR